MQGSSLTVLMSVIVAAALSGAALAAPHAPTICEAHAKSSTQIDVTWFDNARDEDEFIVEYRTDGREDFSHLATVDRNYTRYSHTGLTDGQQYEYRVRARNAAGDSDHSNTARETPTGYFNGNGKRIDQLDEFLVLVAGDRIMIDRAEIDLRVPDLGVRNGGETLRLAID